jgi:hypothetical protein
VQLFFSIRPLVDENESWSRKMLRPMSVSEVYCATGLRATWHILTNWQNMTRQSRREWNFFVLNCNTVYWSIAFANRIESTIYIQFIFKVTYMWEHLQGDWKQSPPKRTNTKPTAWVRTPAKNRLRRIPPQMPLQRHLIFLPSEINFISFRIVRTAHSHSQA